VRVTNPRRAGLLPGVLTGLISGAVLSCGCQSNTAAAGASTAGTPAISVAAATTTGADASPARLRDVAASAGLEYRWTPRDKRPLTILGTIGNGCAFLDYDDDGNLDILLVGYQPALFRGDGKGKFARVSALPALPEARFLGCAVGDYDNDGYPDIYLTAYREGRVLRNNGGKSYADVTANCGIPAQRWASSASFVDVDRDGLLDLYVANYAVFDGNTKPQRCDFAGIQSSCGPRFYEPEKGKLYRNLGGGKFRDVTVASGAGDVHGRGLGVACADYDDSGQDSIAVANDEIPGDLLRNRGGGKFVNEGEIAGTARNSEGAPYGGMGVDWGDYDNDGRLDLFVGTFQNEVKTLYHNDGDGVFTNRSGEMRMDDKALPYVTFGTKFLDVDNDGLLDLILANGHVQDNMERIDSALTYRQPVVLLRNRGTHFDDLTPTALSGLPPVVGRGLATGDYDNDGKVDVLIVDSEGKPLLLHNETATAGNYLSVALTGAGKSGRSAHGARVTAELPDGTKLSRHCQTDGSYLSASDRRVHFGLGAATLVNLTIRWPSGKVTQRNGVATNRRVDVSEE
jgi:enediyne biosynthesis protein E4